MTDSLLTMADNLLTMNDRLLTMGGSLLAPLWNSIAIGSLGITWRRM